MAKFLNGHEYPQFQIMRVSDSELVDTITLTLTNSSGMIESTEILRISHELNDFSILERIYGYRLRWSLPYDEYLNKSNGKNIYRLLTYIQAKETTGSPIYDVYLTPRIDAPKRKWIVLLEDGFDMGIMSGGANAVGNRSTELKFITKNIITDLLWSDPDEIQYSGWGNTFGHSQNFFVSGSI